MTSSAPELTDLESRAQAATNTHKRIFIGYLSILAIAFVLSAVGTVVLWSAGKKDADAVNALANARIERAQEGVETLRHENLGLLSVVEQLKKEAADAYAAQQRVEINLERQKEKTATAERLLAEVNIRTTPRHLVADTRAQLVKALASGPKGKIDVLCMAGNRESCDFAVQLMVSLHDAGWETSGVGTVMIMGYLPTGLNVIVRDVKNAPVRAEALLQALAIAGFEALPMDDASLDPDTVQLRVGAK